MRLAWKIRNGSFRYIQKKASISRIAEERIYEYVFNELKSGVRRDGLWAKALADSGGAEERANTLYIKYRVQSLLDEGCLLEQVLEGLPGDEKTGVKDKSHL